MPYRIAQCYLPPVTGDIPAFTPAEACTQLSDPGGMQGWVDLEGLLHTEMAGYTRSKTVTHPSTNRAWRALTSIMRRTPLTTTPRRVSSRVRKVHQNFVETTAPVCACLCTKYATILSNTRRCFGLRLSGKKVKVAYTPLPSVGFRSWSRFLAAVSLQVTWIINPTLGCHYFPPGLQLSSQPLRGLLPVSLFGEQRHNGCEQFA